MCRDCLTLSCHEDDNALFQPLNHFYSVMTCRVKIIFYSTFTNSLITMQNLLIQQLEIHFSKFSLFLINQNNIWALGH